jgi:hypothetical protein
MSALIQSLYNMRCGDDRQVCKLRWPDPRYRYDPIGFQMDVLGYAPTAVQCQAFEALANHDRILWRSGRRCGKSRFLAGSALWWFTCNPSATIVLGAGCERQITEVVMWDLAELYRNSGVCLSCRIRHPEMVPPCPHSTPVDGELSPSVRTGLRAAGRRLFGAAPRSPDRARGTADPNLLVLLDEGPSIPEEIAQVHRDNCAGGGKFVTALNPSSRFDWTYKFSQEPITQTVVASCLDQPNVKFGRLVQPGLVTLDWVNERRGSWTEQDPRWFTEVLGEYPDNELSRLISEVEFSDACVRGEMMTVESQLNEELHFGIDPASGGDKSVIAPVRGCKMLQPMAFHGGNDRIMTELDGAIRSLQRHPREPVSVKYDASAQWGAHLGQELRQYREADRPWLSVEGLDARGDRSNNYVLRESNCARLRDAYWLNLAGRIKSDLGLLWNQELHDECMLVEVQPDRENGTRVTEQPVFRKRLGHSPDVTNALMYAVWRGTVTPLFPRSPVVPENIPEPARVPISEAEARRGQLRRLRRGHFE